VIFKQAVVIGLGRFGSSVAETLAKQGYEVLGIDVDEKRVIAMSRVLTQAVTVSEVNDEVLAALGVKECDVGVVGMADIESSIIISQILKDFGIKMVVSKAKSELHGRVLERIGVDRVIFPERDMGIRLANSLISNTIVDYIELSKEYNVFEVPTPHKFVGKTLLEANLRSDYKISVIAVKRGDEVVVAPGANFRIQAQDKLVVIGKNNDIIHFHD
jgi:trk system potassium uptake protein TrkA